MKCFKLRTFLAVFVLINFEFGLMSLSVSRYIPSGNRSQQAIKNPVKADAKSIAAGRELWKKNCSFCHGDTGLGDGVKSRTLKVFPGNFSSNAYQSLNEEKIFSRIKFGLEEMPKFDGKIADKDIWHLVNYTRTFKQ